jgi:L-aspartate oxidase
MQTLINPKRWMVNHLSTDVLVIGSGVAGLEAAVVASKYCNVLVTTKRKLPDSNTNEAQGGIAVVLSKDDTYKKHIEDTLTVGEGLCRKEAVEILVKKGPERVKELIDWGASFDSKGEKLFFRKEGGHSINRIIHAQGDATGREVERTLLSCVYRSKNIKVWEEAFCVDLIVKENNCFGAFIYNSQNELYAVSADKVILATGGVCQVYRETTNHDVVTGDGTAMAYRAGAKLQDMEFIQFHPTALYVAGTSRLLISEAVRGEGGVLRNKKGEQFMEKYHPQRDLASRDIVSRAILQEMKNTEATNVYLDVKNIPYPKLKKKFPTLVNTCKRIKLDVRKSLIPVRPSAHYAVGGVSVDLKGKTSIENLLACGEVACTGVHGANRLASNSLLEGLVFGHITATEAGTNICKKRRKVKKSPYQRTKFYDSSVKLNLEDIKNSLKSSMTRDVGIERKGGKLKEAKERINFWMDYVLAREFSQPQGWELQNMLTVASLIVKSALIREESRGVHYRTDFPKKDDKNWKTHIVLYAPDQKKGGVEFLK